MRLLAIGQLSLLVATGCSATVADSADEVDAEAGARGSVSVEQVVQHGAAGPAMRTRVSARFVRVSGGLDHGTADQVVGSQGRPMADLGLGCQWEESVARSASTLSDPSLASEGSIELLDVGDIVLRAGAQIMPLAARAFPDVGDLVSGVVYTSRGGDGALPLAGTYLIETTGSPLVDGFSMRVDAPDAPTGVRFAQGADVVALDASDLVLVSGEPLALSWDTDARSAQGARSAGGDAVKDAGDKIVVEMTQLGSEASTLVCAFDDVGNGVVPASQLVFPSGADVDVSVHRHRRMSVPASQLNARSIDGAVVEFDFAVTARAAVAE
jgi:hypothetical protein